MSLDDFPIRDHNSELARQAEIAFEKAVVEAQQFLIQRDRHDYGTDFQLEAKHSGGMSNFRVHVQLKATDKPANKDGSISVSILRTNLNYLLAPANSIYVCCHVPTGALFVRSVEDVFRDAELDCKEWRSQKSLTVRFRAPFDAQYQASLRARVVAASTTSRNDRLAWVVTPPDQFPASVAQDIPTIVVPELPDDALEVLISLYERGRDEVISKAFEAFSASFGPDNPRLTYAYLSEINLAMRRRRFNRERVSNAIDFITKSRPDDGADALYSRANGHSALQQSEEAKRLYREAIRKATDNPQLAAQCWKNLGSELEQQGDHADARHSYEQAIALSADLMEAHMALAMSHQNSGNLEEALHHLDHVVWAVNEAAVTLGARGRRAEVYFRLGMIDEAFEDISVLLPHGDAYSWILDWCPLMVSSYGQSSDTSILPAIRFWDAFLRMRPKDRRAQKERLLCLARAKIRRGSMAISYERYVADISAYLAVDSSDAAYLWDRAGHWAQADGNWDQAERQYRKAYSLEPDRYGYCLGTALNFLHRYEEALPILLDQATNHHPDAQSWFQVAIAQEGIGEMPDCKDSYMKSLSLDPDYDLAMFNLGGIYWNSGQETDALRTWSEAILRFPHHELSVKLRSDFPDYFGSREDS